MLGLLLQVLPLAIAAAVSPTVFAAAVLILSSPYHPKTKAMAMLAGGAVPFIVIGLGLIRLFQRLQVRLPPFRIPVLSARLDIAFGLVLIAVAIRLLLKMPTVAERGSSQAAGAARSPDAHVLRFFAFGVWSMGTDLTTIALFVPAAHAIAGASVPVVGKIAVFVLVVAVILTPILAPLIVAFVAPDDVERVLVPIGGFARKHTRDAVLVLVAVFGAYLLTRGVLILTR